MTETPLSAPTEKDETLPFNVGVDDGYAAVKLAWYGPDGTIRTHSVPSRIQYGAPGIGFLPGEEQRKVWGYETDGVMYAVGSGVSGVSTRFPDYNLSPLSRVLAHHALIASGFSGEEVRIGSGLPLDRYFREEKEGKRPDEIRAGHKIENFSRPVRRLDGGEPVRIVKHKVLPQGLAAVADWLFDGTSFRDQKAPIGVVDIGGQTTDISVIDPEFQANHGHLRTVDLGVLDVRDILGRQILNSHRDVDKITDVGLDEAMTTGALLIWGKEVSVREKLSAAVREVEARLEQEILSVFGKEASSLETILFVGGGSHVFRNLPERFPSAEVPDAPAFANARGFLKILALKDSGNR